MKGLKKDKFVLALIFFVLIIAFTLYFNNVLTGNPNVLSLLKDFSLGYKLSSKEYLSFALICYVVVNLGYMAIHLIQTKGEKEEENKINSNINTSDIIAPVHLEFNEPKRKNAEPGQEQFEKSQDDEKINIAMDSGVSAVLMQNLFTPKDRKIAQLIKSSEDESFIQTFKNKIKL